MDVVFACNQAFSLGMSPVSPDCEHAWVNNCYNVDCIASTVAFMSQGLAAYTNRHHKAVQTYQQICARRSSRSHYVYCRIAFAHLGMLAHTQTQKGCFKQSWQMQSPRSTQSMRWGKCNSWSSWSSPIWDDPVLRTHGHMACAHAYRPWQSMAKQGRAGKNPNIKMQCSLVSSWNLHHKLSQKRYSNECDPSQAINILT